MKTSLIIIFLSVCLTVFAYARDSYLHIKVSDDIEIIKLSDHVFVHVSYAQMGDYGRVPSNGMIFVVGSQALLFDTPVTDSLTKDLVNWICDSLKVRIVGFVPNHWHVDCMGGLRYIHKIGIPSYANELTRVIAESKKLPVPEGGFTDSLVLHLGDRIAVCRYYGRAHTADNIVTWIPSEQILFGGCMVKEMKSTSLGNIADADLAAWPGTIRRVIAAYPSARVVIPGHGAVGGTELLNHTLELMTKTK
jgi:metallo-beta-lactamase class B